jgi:hypothetical protein
VSTFCCSLFCTYVHGIIVPLVPLLLMLSTELCHLQGLCYLFLLYPELLYSSLFSE